MKAKGTQVACEIPSEVGSIDMVVFFAEKIGEFCGLGEDERVKMGMALREALNNAVVHGNRKDPGKKVRISFLRGAGELRISVRDEGPGFSTEHLPDPRDPMNLLKTSGRGIFCIHAFMDDVDLSRASHEGGEVVMVKRLPGCPQAEAIPNELGND